MKVCGSVVVWLFGTYQCGSIIHGTSVATHASPALAYEFLRWHASNAIDSGQPEVGTWPARRADNGKL